MNKTPREILDASLRERVPDELNLFPRIAAQLQKEKQPMQPRMKLTLAFVLIVAVFVVIFTSTPGVASAMRRMIGFIPGFGMVDQGASIRVLAAPVSQTRDGVTVTVESAILTAERTVITYSQENIPQSAMSHDESVPGCSGLGILRLPDGTELNVISGEGSFGKSRMVYGSIPMDVDHVSFLLSCVTSTLPGKAPENWELPIRFVPAPPEMTVVPVVELATATPTPPADSVTVTPGPVETATPQVLVIEKALQLPDKLIFIGGFVPHLPAGTFIQTNGDMKISDATGREIQYDIPTEDLEIPTYDNPNAFPWTAQISSAGLSYPLTFTYSGSYASEPDPQATLQFELDVDQFPQSAQDWQEWPINREFTLAGHKIKLTSISVTHHAPGYFYSFQFECEPDVVSLNVDTPGQAPVGGGGGGGGTPGSFSVAVSLEKPLSGKVQVVLSHLNVITGSDTWQAQWSPDGPQTSPSLYGISFQLDKFIALADGYYLIGHTDWTDERLAGAGPLLKAYDAKGNEVPLDDAVSSDDSAIARDLKPNQWTYHLYGKTFNGPLTLRATQMSISFKQPVKVLLDLRPFTFAFTDDQLNKRWKTGLIPIDIPGIRANVVSVTYVKDGDMRGFEINIDADSALNNIGFRIESGLDTSGLSMVSGGGGGLPRDDKTNLLTSIFLTNGKISFPLGLAADGVMINGKWETTWDPPAGDPHATPSTIPAACITLDGWKQAAANPAPLLTGLQGKILLGRGALAPAPSLFLSNLDGSDEKPLIFGDGALSPDGAQLAYSSYADGLKIMSIASGQSTSLLGGTVLYAPSWSPDGKQIAYTRQIDKGMNIYVMDANGQNIRALTDTTENPSLTGWMPDGLHVVIATQKTEEMVVEIVDTITASKQPLLTLHQQREPFVSISPDGKWLAFPDKVQGKQALGIFISRLDGSARRLMMQLDYWIVSHPVWSTDGRWLAVTIVPNEGKTLPATPALVNVETCQVLPLTNLTGQIQQWVNP